MNAAADPSVCSCLSPTVKRSPQCPAAGRGVCCEASRSTAGCSPCHEVHQENASLHSHYRSPGHLPSLTSSASAQRGVQAGDPFAKAVGSSVPLLLTDSTAALPAHCKHTAGRGGVSTWRALPDGAPKQAVCWGCRRPVPGKAPLSSRAGGVGGRALHGRKYCPHREKFTTSAAPADPSPHRSLPVAYGPPAL